MPSEASEAEIGEIRRKSTSSGEIGRKSAENAQKQPISGQKRLKSPGIAQKRRKMPHKVAWASAIVRGGSLRLRASSMGPARWVPWVRLFRHSGSFLPHPEPLPASVALRIGNELL
jgi:hypothetical protein